MMVSIQPNSLRVNRVGIGQVLEWVFIPGNENVYYKNSEGVHPSHLPSKLTLPFNLHMLFWLLLEGQ